MIKCISADLSTRFLFKNLQKFNDSVEWRFELQVLRNKCTNGESPLFNVNRKGNLRFKQGVKLRDANQQWIATITELFEKTISACKDNHYESKKLSFRTG